MKKNKIIFSVLGGGQRVGASCYYLGFRGHHILLDAGIDSNKGGPVWSHLLNYCLNSMNQIENIYVSHAHMDHIGSLTGIMTECSQANVYMTEMTKSFTRLQIYDRIYFNSLQSHEKKQLAVKNCLDRITSVSYMKTMDFHDYRVTFYPAGHIPGAMMTLFEIKGGCNILYTGDYSVSDSPLCSGCYIPKDKKIDVVILCGLHACHPHYQKKQDDLFRKIQKIFCIVRENHHSVQCCISQLSKGVEFLKLLNEENTTGIPVFIDDTIMEVVREMERNGFHMVSEYTKPVSRISFSRPFICLTSENRDMNYCDYKMNVDFTLHEDFEEMKQFIKTINPKYVYLVHCAKPRYENDVTIEQVLLMDEDCRTQFTFAQDENIYYI